MNKGRGLEAGTGHLGRRAVRAAGQQAAHQQRWVVRMQRMHLLPAPAPSRVRTQGLAQGLA